MKKKKILFLSDDLRMHSGVATQSKEIVMNTIHKYDWVQVAAAIKHPDEGKIIDMNQAVRDLTGVQDAKLKLYPVSGYGNPDLIRMLIEEEKPDAILHYTDPRFWDWLYNMEHEIRQDIPIVYYNIWDDLPDPMYNRNYYRSSNTLLAISKQTYGINKRVVPEYDDWQIHYVPHGVSAKRFHNIPRKDLRLTMFNQEFGLDKYKFKVLYLNRNIRRKNPGDVALAYKSFMDSLTPEQREECCLIFHSAPVDENGTDMKAVCRSLLPEYPVIFTYDLAGPMGFNDEKMNLLYNTADVYVNIASNEGFGLGSLEALAVGTPIVVNVTGGLQDQCGFKEMAPEPAGGGFRYLNEEDYVELGSNHRGQYKYHGEWVEPVFPSNISLAGSPQTPYIFDDRCSYEDAGDALLNWYHAGPTERERCGEIGKKWVQSDNAKMTAKHLSNSFIESIDTTFKNWKPKAKYTMEGI